jgi:RNA polymerase sigma factor (sigma-70 family)
MTPAGRYTAQAPSRHRRDDMAALTDADLLIFVRAGDSAAYAELWKRHRPAAERIARKASTRFDADDLVSEAFTKVLRKVVDGAEVAKFRAYLGTTIRNLAIDWCRYVEETTADADAWESLPADTTPADGVVIARLESQIVADAMAALPEASQRLLWQAFVERKPPREIAAELGQKPNTVSQNVRRARANLQYAWVQAHIKRAVEQSVGDHRFALQRTSRYLVGVLTPTEREIVGDHLDSCGECGRAVADARLARSRLSTPPVVAAAAAPVTAPRDSAPPALPMKPASPATSTVPADSISVAA